METEYLIGILLQLFDNSVQLQKLYDAEINGKMIRINENVENCNLSGLETEKPIIVAPRSEA
jgi:hypothetical protein